MRNVRLHNRFILAVTTTFLLFLSPLTGALPGGTPLGQYLEFPPLTRYVIHQPFNRTVFALGVIVFVLIMGVLALWIRNNLAWPGEGAKKRFPWWGWLGIMLVMVSWILAWTRFSWFAYCQPYTFTPLWLGAILAVNGLSWRLTGDCLMTRAPGQFALLFPVSSVFWWYFEWLNRFVQNWYYVGAERFSATGYVIHASLCFSTVLPAVLSTCALLASLSRMEPLNTGLIPRTGTNRAAGWLLLIAAACILAALGRMPDLLFPFVWIAPGLIIIALHWIMGRSTLLDKPARDNWLPVVLPALAALVCGLFWELWNWRSLPQWQYSIPYVDRFHLFAMPILGYLGYLPFGVQCVLVSETFVGLSPYRD